jgi:hypothetical protein
MIPIHTIYVSFLLAPNIQLLGSYVNPSLRLIPEGDKKILSPLQTDEVSLPLPGWQGCFIRGIIHCPVIKNELLQRGLRGKIRLFSRNSRIIFNFSAKKCKNFQKGA